MKHYIVYCKEDGKIIRTGICPDSMLKIQNKGREGVEIVMEGCTNQMTQKIVDGEIVDKTLAELEQIKKVTDIKPPQSPEDRPAKIRKKDWQELLNRIVALETAIKP